MTAVGDDRSSVDEARAALVCDGTLRVALNLSNNLLVGKHSDTGEPEGVAPTLAERLAGELGARVAFVRYATPGQVIDDAARDAWSLAFVGADPRRAAATVFSAPYAEIEATYLVAADSPLRDVAAVDAPGHRIASFRGSAYDLWLQQRLQHAELVHADTPAAAVELFRAQRLDALAGLRVHLDPEAARPPGARVLDGRFMTVLQAIGMPRSRAAALPFVDDFLRRQKRSGALAALIDGLAPPGLSVHA